MSSDKQNSNIHLPLSPKSQSDLQKFLETLQKVSEEAKKTRTTMGGISLSMAGRNDQFRDLKQDLKQLDLIMKAMDRNAIVKRAGGFFEGAKFKAEQRADATARLGSSHQQDISKYREQTRLIKTALSYEKERDALQRAQGVKLDGRVLQLRKITDLEKLRATMQTLELRKGQEIAAGNAPQARRAERLLQIARERTKELEAAKKAEVERAKAEQEQLRNIGRTGRQVLKERKREQDELKAAKAQAASEETKQLRSIGRSATMMMKDRKREQAELKAEEKALQSEQTKQIRAVGRSATMMMKDRKREQNELAAKERKAAQDQQQALRNIGRSARLMMKERKREQAELNKLKERENRIKAFKTGDREMERARATADWRRRRDAMDSSGGAEMFGVQARVMANYALMNAGRNTISGTGDFTADLDESLRNLQAITVVTDENLADLKEEILDVSQATKFFATDIASASVTLGQAGFSTKEIKDSIRAVALLATATGTDLGKSVDLATSILGVFKMESAQMAGVADTLTAAVNNSKLNLDKLTLGLQYAGNTAAQSGVSFEELTASFGAMANAGIRSGSTLGTGMRQILISLQKPSGNFKASLDELGLSMSDVDLRANGLYGVMKNLAEGGFTAENAIRSFEVRAAAAFNALSGNLGEVVKLERAFLNSSAAMAANETQMRALTNQGKRFKANLATIVSTGLEPLVYTARDALKWMADMFETWREAPGVIRGLVVSLASLTAGLVAARVAWLGLNLLTMITGLKQAYTAMVALRSGAALATLAVAPLGIAVAGVAAGVTLGAIAFNRYNNELKRSAEAVERAQTSFDRLKGSMEETGTQIVMVDDRIQSLTDRTELLKKEDELLQLETDKVREQFREMGIELGENVSSVDELVKALQVLRGELAKKFVVRIEQAGDGLESLLNANRNKFAVAQSDKALTNITGRMGRNNFKNLGFGNVPDIVAGVQGEGVSLEDLHAARSRLIEVESQMPKNLMLTRKPVQDAYEHIDRMIQIRNASLSLQQQLTDIRGTEANERNLLENPGIQGQVDQLTAGQDTRVENAADATNGTAVDRFKAARMELSKIEKEAEALISAISEHSDLNDTNKERLRNEVKNSVAAMRMATVGLGEAAQEVAEEAAEVEQIRANTRYNQLSSDQSLASDPSQIQALGVGRAKAVNDEFLADRSALMAEYNQDASSEMFQAKLEQLKAEHTQKLLTIETETDNFLAAQQQSQLRHIEVQENRLRRHLENSADAEERTGLRDELAQQLIQRAEIMRSQAEQTIQNDEDLAIAVAEIEETLAAGLEDLSDGNVADELSEASRDTQIAKDALDAVLRLGDEAKTHAENAAWYKKVIAKAKAWAEALRNEAALAAEGDGVGEDSVADANSEIDKVLDSAEDSRNRNTRRITRAGRSGGGRKRRGGSKNKEDEVDKLISSLKSKISAAEVLIKMGETHKIDLDGTLDKAQDKLGQVIGQIATMKSKLETGGSLNAKEQERLNELVDRQGKLTSFIREENQRIALLKLKQGQYMEGIVMTAAAWSEQNLSLSNTLQEGITGALTSAKSALTEFFTSWTDGTKNGIDAFRSLAAGVVKSIHQIFTEMLAVYLLQKALGWLGGKIGGDFGASLTEMASGLREGGDVKKAAFGTEVKGNLNRDSQRYDLMPGEYVLRRSAVQAVGVEELDRLNAMGNRTVSSSNIQGAAQSGTQQSSVGGDTNIYLIDERSAAPTLGANDVVAIISDDMARGGNTKKLIKSIQSGNM